MEEMQKEKQLLRALIQEIHKLEAEVTIFFQQVITKKNIPTLTYSQKESIHNPWKARYEILGIFLNWGHICHSYQWTALIIKNA